MDIQKLESISKIIAAICIPLAVAFLGNQVSISNKKQDTETKLVELATVILTKDINKNSSQEHKNIRKWAVDVINTYSGVPMDLDTQQALVDRISLPSAPKTTEDIPGTWGVVFGGDKTLEEAKYEINVTAKKASIDNAQIFLRSGSYRSVVVYTSRADAEESLGKLKIVRASSYIVDMNKWCTNTTKQNSYYECKIS